MRLVDQVGNRGILSLLRQSQGGVVARQAAGAPAPAQAQAPAAPAPPHVYDDACSGKGPDNPCQISRCSSDEVDTILADLNRGLDWAGAVKTALAASPLSESTITALDWYFGGHAPDTVKTVAATMECVAQSLATAISARKFGCDPDHGLEGAHAYSCSFGAKPCEHMDQDICLVPLHFSQGDRGRGIDVVHEAGHLEGLSSNDTTSPDLSETDKGFWDMGPAQALQNAEMYALFAAAIGTHRIPGKRWWTASLDVGKALAGGTSAWYARLTVGAEKQSPRIQLFNPTLQAALTFVGEAVDQTGGGKVSPSIILSGLLGARIGRPRHTGGNAGLELSLSAGPTLSLGGESSTDAALGADVGIWGGYRWRKRELGVGLRYLYDPHREEAGQEHLITIGVGVGGVF